MFQDTLFKYVLDNLESYLTKHYDDTELQKDIAALRELVSTGNKGGLYSGRRGAMGGM